MAHISGTKVSVSNSLLLVSSGVPSLDELVGGGLPVGSVVLIEEDLAGIYSKIMLSYFLAEGAVNRHSLFVASQEINPLILVSSLPAPTDGNDDSKTEKANDERMSIAWRYHHLPQGDHRATKQLGHNFDLTRKIDPKVLDAVDVEYWNGQNCRENAPETFSNAAYHDLLDKIKTKLNEGGFCSASSDNILRIGLHSLGSPLWLCDCSHHAALPESRDLDVFFYCLRSLLRTAYAIAVLTVPVKFLNKERLARCVHSSDVVLKLESFSGTENETNPALSDYQGFFHLKKLAAINCLRAKEPDIRDFAFKLRRRKFTIEPLHLPPELESTTNREQDELPMTFGCGGSGKHLLDF